MTPGRPTRVLAVLIANGYSSEASVLATMLGARPDGIETLVLHHESPDDRASAGRFESEARTPAVRFDTGFRSDPAGRRSVIAKVASEGRFRLTLPRMLQAARDWWPDVIVSSQQKWDCRAATLIAQRLSKPQLIYLHFIIGPWLGSGLTRLTTCEHVVAISDFIRGQALDHGVRPDRVTTIMNPLRVREAVPGSRERVRAELRIDAHAPVIGIVGRLDRYKGQRDTIHAFSKIAERYPSARLLIVGSTVMPVGTSRAELEAEAARTGFGDRIIFTGQRADVSDLLAALDIFIHPSRDEPFGLAIVEASAARLPVVAYAEGAVPEIVEHGTTGLLAPPGDTEALAASLTALIDHPEMRVRMGEAGRRWVESRLRPEDAARRFADIVLQLDAAGISRSSLAASENVRTGALVQDRTEN